MKRKILALVATLGLSVAGVAVTATPAQAYGIGPGDCSWNGGNTLWYNGGFWMNGNSCYLTSKTKLSMQRDGNLVLYCVDLQGGIPVSGRPVWSTGTWNSGAIAAKFQDDGNFVLYSSDYATSVWASRTWGHANSHLAIQNDSNIVIYNFNGYPIWQSNTYNAC
ncbi:hypothetical protein ACIQJ4_08515 [Streptomyces filamentosus]|uniref:hypothetical protein n=1 Tax=Streptomyces filamentosus TaxID=67294 RepID=UPI0037F36358